MKTPEKRKISNHADLAREIMFLHQRKAAQEEKLKQSIKELYYSFHPSEIIRNAVENFKNSSSTRSKVLKTGLGIGAAFLLKRVLAGKGSLASLIFKTAGKSILGKYGDLISSGLSKLGGLFARREAGRA